MATTQRQQLLPVIVFLSIPLFLLGVSAVLGNNDAEGYGYGYGACTADAPTGLAVKNKPKHRRVFFQWKKVTFENCDSTKPDAYDVQIENAKGKVVVTFSNVTKTQKAAPVALFKPNTKYRFAVRAIAVDDAATDYSADKKFTVAPQRPGLITIELQSPTQVRASWKNIPKSRKLKYYQVILKENGRIVLREKVRKSLRKKRTGITLENLTPNTRYKILVRSVRAKGVRSLERTRIFRTPPL